MKVKTSAFLDYLHEHDATAELADELAELLERRRAVRTNDRTPPERLAS